MDLFNEKSSKNGVVPNTNNVHAIIKIVKLIDKYILKQVLLYSLLCMGMFIFVLVVGKVIRDGSDLLVIGMVSPSMAGELLLMLVLYVINYALPLGFLTSILLVLGRLSSQREIVAMKASGISVYRIAMPVLVLGIVGTFLSMFINAYYAPYAKTTYLQNSKKILMENPLRYLRERTFMKELPGYVIYVGKKNKNELQDCWLWEVDPAGVVKSFIKAKRGRFGFDPKTGDGLLTLYEGTGEIRDINNLENFQDVSVPVLTYEELSLRLPFGELFSQKSKYNKKFSAMTVFELFDLKKLYSLEGSAVSKAELTKVKTEIQRKFAMAFSVFALVLIAIPLGIKASRSETYANLGIAIILAIVYYAMIMLVTSFDQRPELMPDLLIWIPNLFFIGLGLYLLKKANRN